MAWVYVHKIPIYPIFCQFKGEYNVQGLGSGTELDDILLVIVVFYYPKGENCSSPLTVTPVTTADMITFLCAKK